MDKLHLQFPELYVSMVDENPRTRKRTVPMQVLVLGFPRTGTSSIQKAIEELGFGKCYHMRVAMNERPRDCALWLDAFKLKYDEKGIVGKDIFDQLLGDCGAVCDLPAIAFAPELMAAYPHARIILTCRDAMSWHNSCTETIVKSNEYWGHNILQHIDWATALVHPMRQKMWQCMFRDDFDTSGTDVMLASYETVRRIAKESGREILEMHCKEGWEPLCKFLGVEVPGTAFPHVNDGTHFVAKMKWRAALRLKASLGKLAERATFIGFIGLGVWYILS